MTGRKKKYSYEGAWPPQNTRIGAKAIFNHKVFRQALADIKALGFYVSDHPSPSSIPYAIIGGRSNARWWLIPLSNRHVAVSGLAMFQPVVSSARIIKSVAAAAGSIGLASIWTCKRIYISGHSLLTEVFGEKDLYYTFFTGTDSPHRKVAVQIMGRDGCIKGFAKVACNPIVKPLLAHEGNILDYVSTLKLETAVIPRVLYCGDVGDAAVLVTDTLKTREARTVTVLTDMHLAFLRELADKSALPGTTGTDWVMPELRRQYEAVVDTLTAEWQKRLEKAIGRLERYEGEWGSRSLSHGDFTPWNTFFVRDKLYVFDWEYSSQRCPNGHDLIHYALSLPPLIHLSPNETISQVRMVLHGLDFVGNDSNPDLPLLCYLCGHSLHYIGRELMLNRKCIGWDSERRFSNLLDAIVEWKN